MQASENHHMTVRAAPNTFWEHVNPGYSPALSDADLRGWRLARKLRRSDTYVAKISHSLLMGTLFYYPSCSPGAANFAGAVNAPAFIPRKSRVHGRAIFEPDRL